MHAHHSYDRHDTSNYLIDEKMVPHGKFAAECTWFGHKSSSLHIKEYM